jgi:hypothetical protein
MCGQLARVWGNERFGAVQPLEEVALGAASHDVGMAAWDREPAINPETGLPQSFMEMGIAVNASLWRAGPASLVIQSRYAALLAAMHGRRLYEHFDLERAPAAEAEAVRILLREEGELEAWLLASLRADPETAPDATPERVERNSLLVWTWDTLTLGLLLDWAPMTVEDVPVADGATVEVVLASAGDRAGAVVASLDPWPFAAGARVTLHCEGRRLSERYASQEQLARGLRQAPWETIRFELVPGAGGQAASRSAAP